MAEEPLSMETLVRELRKASREGPLTLKPLWMLTTYESRQAAVRNNPEYMDTVRRACAVAYAAVGMSDYERLTLSGELDDDYNMDSAVEMFALGLIAGLNAKASIKETEQ